MQTDYFIAFASDATRVNDMSVYVKEMRLDMTVCKVYLSKDLVKIKCATKSITLSDTTDCNLANVEDVLDLIREYCEEYPDIMEPFDFGRLTQGEGDTTYITENSHYHTHDEAYDSVDYKDIVNHGSRLREEDNYATLKMEVMTLKEDLYHRISAIEESLKILQETQQHKESEDQIAQMADKLTGYVDTRVAAINNDISQVTEVLNTVTLLDKILR